MLEVDPDSEPVEDESDEDEGLKPVRLGAVRVDSPGMPGEPKRPWVKLELPPGAGAQHWADLLHDLDVWLRQRGTGVTIFDVQPVRDDPPMVPVDRRAGTDRRADV